MIDVKELVQHGFRDDRPFHPEVTIKATYNAELTFMTNWGENQCGIMTLVTEYADEYAEEETSVNQVVLNGCQTMEDVKHIYKLISGIDLTQTELKIEL